MDTISKSKYNEGGNSLLEGATQRHSGALFLACRNAQRLDQFRMVEPSYLHIKVYSVRRILHQCSQECAKCIQYIFYIGRRSRWVVKNRETGHLAKSWRLNKRHSLKPADLEMVEALHALTPRHQRNRTLPCGTQEYVKYIHWKKLLGRLAVFRRRQLILSNAIVEPSSDYVEIHNS